MDILLEYIQSKINELNKIITSGNDYVTYLNNLKSNPESIIEDSVLLDELSHSELKELKMLYLIISNGQYEMYSSQPQVVKSLDSFNDFINKKISEVPVDEDVNNKLNLLNKCYLILKNYDQNKYISPEDVDIIYDVYQLYVEENILSLESYVILNRFLFDVIINNSVIELSRQKEKKQKKDIASPKKKEEVELEYKLSKDESKKMLEKKISKTSDKKTKDKYSGVKKSIKQRFTCFIKRNEDNEIYKKILYYIELALETLNSDLSPNYNLLYNEKTDEWLDFLEPSDGLYVMLALHLIDYYYEKNNNKVIELLDRFIKNHVIDHIKKNPEGFEEYLDFINIVDDLSSKSEELKNYILSHENDDIVYLNTLINEFSNDKNLQTFQYYEFLAVIYQAIIKSIDTAFKKSNRNKNDEVLTSDMKVFLDTYKEFGLKVYNAIIDSDVLALPKEETADEPVEEEPTVALNIDDRDYFVNDGKRPVTQNIFCFPGIEIDKKLKKDRYKDTIYTDFGIFDPSMRKRVYGGLIEVFNQLHKNKDYETKQGGEPKYFSKKIVKSLKDLGFKYIRPGVSQADYRIHAITRESAFLAKLGYGTGKITFIGAIGPNDDNEKDTTYQRNASRVIDHLEVNPVLQSSFDYIEHITRGYIPKEFFSKSDQDKAFGGKFNGDTKESGVINGRKTIYTRKKAEGKKYTDEHYYAYYTVLDKATIENVNSWLYNYFAKNSELMFDIYDNYKKLEGFGGK